MQKVGAFWLGTLCICGCGGDSPVTDNDPGAAVTRASIAFDLVGASATPANVRLFSIGCWPPNANKDVGTATGAFTVTDATVDPLTQATMTSTMAGTCQTSLGSTTTLTGTVNWRTELLSFSMTVTSSFAMGITQTFTGTGILSDSHHGIGTADWQMTCQNGNGYICAGGSATVTSVTSTGRVPFTLTFLE